MKKPMRGNCFFLFFLFLFWCVVCIIYIDNTNVTIREATVLLSFYELPVIDSYIVFINIPITGTPIIVLHFCDDSLN